MTAYPLCDLCGAPVLHAISPKGNKMQLDPEPGSGGKRWTISKDGHAHFIDPFDRRQGIEGHASHKDTCDGPEWKKRIRATAERMAREGRVAMFPEQRRLDPQPVADYHGWPYRGIVA